MTNERACANNRTRPKPVTRRENASVQGQALCADYIFRENIEKAERLRSQQANYLDSLPAEPSDAIRAALGLMNGGGLGYPEGAEEVLHFSVALEAMIQNGHIDEEGPVRDAALYMADRVAMAAWKMSTQLDLISDLLQNPGRIERDR
ncbi:hypothetical protein [uncultured Roseobacter sp.]|uniref:hypothetical protein n=1 Tax=uncultured Roseobacter sp. TaxID=114847 RepID=UPI0026236654|nr:hypothetical protein [uncultured Roseobacter sp.]